MRDERVETWGSNANLQANNGEHQDSLVSAPESIRKNSTNPGSDVNPETVKLENNVEIIPQRQNRQENLLFGSQTPSVDLSREHQQRCRHPGGRGVLSHRQSQGAT
jgi:hypothetical protein